MKSEAQAIADARFAIEHVRRGLEGRRPPKMDERARMVRYLNGALVDLKTADIAAGRLGIGAVLAEPRPE